MSSSETLGTGVSGGGQRANCAFTNLTGSVLEDVEMQTLLTCGPMPL